MKLFCSPKSCFMYTDKAADTLSGSAIPLVPSLALAELVLENFSLKVFSLKFRKKIKN